MPSPVQDVTFGQGLQISLNNYYDLLKTQAATLGVDEFLQIKLVADPVSISWKKYAEGGYPWFSQYNLLRRADMSIVPQGVSGGVMTGIAMMSAVYGEFLQKLRGYVVLKNLSAEEQLEIADLDKKVESDKSDAVRWMILDRANWKQYAEAMGYAIGDNAAYVQWSSSYGHIRQIQNALDGIKRSQFRIKTIMDRQYPDPGDREIVEAEFDYTNPAMRLRFPVNADTDYPMGASFDIVYLSMLPLGSTALFDDRLTVGWNMALKDIKETTAGSFAQGVTYDRTTTKSTSISTDWGASGNASYYFINVNASAGGHTEIQEDFSHATGLTLTAEAAFRVTINWPSWFRPNLFNNHHVTDNPHDFLKFFGPNGTLLYYPTGLILVRGFGVTFTSSQNWSYDYKHHFSASAGGGFSCFGYSFGASGSYTEDTHEHQTDQQNTKLSFKDDKDTLRFVGYSVRKNTVFQNSLRNAVYASMAVSFRE
jgi:hypothetical protein